MAFLFAVEERCGQRKLLPFFDSQSCSMWSLKNSSMVHGILFYYKI